jgi:hypothetical protein
MMRTIFLVFICSALLWSCSADADSGLDRIYETAADTTETEGEFENMKILTYSLGATLTNCYLIYDENSGKACLLDAPEYNDEIMDMILSNGLYNTAKKLADLITSYEDN